MSQYRIAVISDPADPHLVEVEQAFTAMYRELEGMGPVLPLADGGAARWLASATGGLERFGRLCIALCDGRPIGFAHGQVKLAPEHQGALRVGHIGHVYVHPVHRGKGQARALVQCLHDWFAERQVHSVELQVVHGNARAIAFWHHLGYVDELLQMRRK